MCTSNFQARGSSVPPSSFPPDYLHHQACEYSGPLNMEVSVFPVGVAIHTHTVECYEARFQSSRYMLVRKANQRLALCVPMLL